MNFTDNTRTITAVRSTGPASLHLVWSDGTQADLDLNAALGDRSFAALRDPAEFARVEVGDWGHSLAWPSGAELGADALWLAALPDDRIDTDDIPEASAEAWLHARRPRFNAVASTALAVEELDEETLKALAASRMDSSHDRLNPDGLSLCRFPPRNRS